MNAPCIRVCFSIFSIRLLVNFPPQNDKISWIYSKIAHFSKNFLNVLSKIDQNFWEKKKSLLCMGRNRILFKSDFGENSPIKNHCKWTGLHFHKTSCLLLQIPVPAS
jgi:hypothetical protein